MSIPRALAPVARAALFAGVLCLAGCSAQKTVSGWFGAAPTPAPAAAGQVYYAGAAGLEMHSEPAASSKLIGKLALHERVTRYRIERGYAYVKSEKSGMTGWVDNAMLLWRLPGAAPARAEPTPETPPGAGVEEPSAAPEIPATPESPPSPTATRVSGATPTPSSAAPSMFDPY